MAVKKRTVMAKPSKGKGFTEAEKAAMRSRVKELQSAKGEGEEALLESIAKMPLPDREMGARIHKIVIASAPALEPKTWYGMPAYAKDGKAICFFKAASKFKARYATFGFNDSANLDDGDIWPVEYAINKLTAATEAKIGALVKKAAN